MSESVSACLLVCSVKRPSNFPHKFHKLFKVSKKSSAEKVAKTSNYVLKQLIRASGPLRRHWGLKSLQTNWLFKRKMCFGQVCALKSVAQETSQSAIARDRPWLRWMGSLNFPGAQECWLMEAGFGTGMNSPQDPTGPYTQGTLSHTLTFFFKSTCFPNIFFSAASFVPSAA